MRTRNRILRRFMIVAIASLMLALGGVTVRAQDDADTDEEAPVETPAEEAPAEEEALAVEVAVDPAMEAVTAQVGSLTVSVDTMWVLMTGFLVFFMQLGFAMLEAGLVRQTGVVNALLENFIDAGLTALIFWGVGFGIAFGTDSGGLIGTDNFFLAEAFTISEGSIIYHTIAEVNPDIAYPNLGVLTFFFFQFAFAATASTITTGAMAERTDYIGDLIYTGLMAATTYPIIVHWVWGGGWLFDRSFHDFAGSTVVHTVGGITAIVGAWILGPRPNREFGKFPPAHNLGLATLGTMILWFGWYGFNPGSTLGAGNTGLIGLVTINTTLGAGAGMVVCMLLVWFLTGKWDLTFTLNGSLAGLVAITAGCAFVTPVFAIIIGAIAGVIVYYAVEAVERMKIDDPVGAFSVHACCGIWGTIAIGLFAEPALAFGEYAGEGGLLMGGGTGLLVTQLIGSASTIVFIAVTSVIMFGTLNMVNRLRVDPVADQTGIDAYEHGVSLWPDILPMPSVIYHGKSEPAPQAQSKRSSSSASD